MAREMELLGVRVDVPSNTPAMLLREVGGDERHLNILIGGPEAQAIAFALDGVTTRRPMTHDLIVLLLDELDASIERVVVSGLHDNVYYADIVLVGPDGNHTVSARPSDAVAIAVRANTPIFAAEDVLESAGYVEWTGDDDDDDDDADEVVEQFKEFIDQVNPEDFAS